MMKKIAIIFSLVIIVVLSTGSFFIHQSYLSSYKKEFRSFISLNKKTIQSSEITINTSELYINTSTITWEDDTKEIIYNGVLCDVISVKTENKKTVITVITDKQEQSIKEQFATLYNDDSYKTSKKPLQLLKQFLSLKYVTHTTTFSALPLKSTILINNSNYYFNIEKVFLPQETPPPTFSA